MNKLNKSVLTKSIALERKYLPVKDKNDKRLTFNDVLAGVEIELENLEDPRRQIGVVCNAGWEEMIEGSLVNGHEFAMYPPRNGADLTAAVDKFFDSGFNYTTGERTSIHIHVDMMDGTTVGQLRSVVSLIYALEGPIYRAADENRKWASYSCPLTDMTPERFGNFLGTESGATFKSAMSGVCHEDKYFGCNLASIRKHGTLEFRYFPCTTSKSKLLDWVNMCIELKKAGTLFNSVEELSEGLDDEAALIQFLQEQLPETWKQIHPYIDTADSLRRLKEVVVVSSYNREQPDPKVSPAVQFYLDRAERKKEEQEGKKKPARRKAAAPEVFIKPYAEGHVGDLGDLHDILRQHQRIRLNRGA